MPYTSPSLASRYAPRALAIFRRDFTLSAVKKILSRFFWLVGAEKKNLSVKLRHSEASYQRNGESLRFFQTCQNSDLSRVQSHLVPHRHLYQNQILKLEVPGRSSLQKQTEQSTTGVHNRRASIPWALDRARFSGPYGSLASKIADGCHLL